MNIQYSKNNNISHLDPQNLDSQDLDSQDLDSQSFESSLDNTSNSKHHLQNGELQQTDLDYTILDLVSHPICIVDVGGAIKYVNRHWSKISGSTDIKLLDKKLFNIIHYKEREEFFHIWQESVTQSQSFEAESLIYLNDGKYSWFSISAQPRFNVRGEAVEWVLTCTEIQKYKQAEQEFEKQSEFINALLTNLSDGIVACDKHGNLTLFNQASIEFHGLEVKNIPPQQWAEYYGLYLPDCITPMSTAEIPLFRVLQGESVRDVEMAIVPKQGSPRILLASGDPIINSAGEKLGAVVAMHDITTQKQVLQESEERFRTTFEQVAVGFAHLDLDGKWLRVNQKLCEIIGYSHEEILNLTFQDITYPDDLETDLNYVHQLLAGEIEYYSMEKRYIRKDGSTVWVEITPSLMRNPRNREPMYFIAVVEEIEERKHGELQLQQKVEELAQTNLVLRNTTAELHKRNEELDQFAYFASHDLKAPLRAIANLSQWLEDDLCGNLPPENQHQLELLRGRVHRMENLINGLLEYSRIGRVKAGLQTVNTNIILKEIIDILAPPSEFTIKISSEMPTLRTKRLLLQQVFTNLISNGIKHHPSNNGCINISVSELEKFYEFTVGDDGAGISPEFHQKIFTIFQTLEARDTKESTGVGLAIVKKIIESMGGLIKVESQLGNGAKFIFTWPKEDKVQQHLFACGNLSPRKMLLDRKL